jgi:hypothetical protein
MAALPVLKMTYRVIIASHSFYHIEEIGKHGNPEAK